MPTTNLAAQRVAIARAERASRRTGDSALVEDARRDYAAAKLADYIKRTVDAAPPLSPEQRERLAALLRGGGQLAS
jgi:hypothetical protein